MLRPKVSWQNWKMVSQFPSEDNLGWRQIEVLAWSISVVHQGPGELVVVQAAAGVRVLPEDPLGDLHTELGALVAVGVVGTGQPVVDSPLLEEVLGHAGDKLKAAVGGDLLADSVGEEVMTEPLYQDLGPGPSLHLVDSGPVTESVHYDEVLVAPVAEVIRTNLFKWICWAR